MCRHCLNSRCDVFWIKITCVVSKCGWNYQLGNIEKSESFCSHWKALVEVGKFLLESGKFGEGEPYNENFLTSMDIIQFQWSFPTKDQTFRFTSVSKSNEESIKPEYLYAH